MFMTRVNHTRTSHTPQPSHTSTTFHLSLLAPPFVIDASRLISARPPPNRAAPDSMLRTGHRLASSPASNGGFPNKTNVRTARVSSIVPRAMVTIIKNANGWEEKCKKCFLCRSHYSRRADEPGNGRIPAVFAGIPDYSGCLLGSSSGMGAHITRPNGICCCCCCPSDLIYTRITSNIDPDDW
eukprot:440579-Amorphochlora_amoeboformis.AAC.2